jgi:predicted dehydrogenase
MHAAQLATGLRAGVHIICEQPLADSLDGIRTMLAAAQGAPQCAISVQRMLRWTRLHLAARQSVQSGALGCISYAEAHSVQDARKRLSLHDTWAIELAPSPFLLAGCHAIDLLRWILDDEVVEICGMGNNRAFPGYRNDDLCTALLRFRSGVIAKVTAAFAAGRMQDQTLRLIGSDCSIDGNLVLDPQGPRAALVRPVLRQRNAPGLSLKQRAGALWRDLRHNSGPVLFDRLFGAARWLSRRNVSYPVSAYPLRIYEHSLALRAGIGDFVDSIRSGNRSRLALHDAARTLATCLAATESIRTGRSVCMDDWRLAELDQPRERPASARQEALTGNAAARAGTT